MSPTYLKFSHDIYIIPWSYNDTNIYMHTYRYTL